MCICGSASTILLLHFVHIPSACTWVCLSALLLHIPWKWFILLHSLYLWSHAEHHMSWCDVNVQSVFTLTCNCYFLVFTLHFFLLHRISHCFLDTYHWCLWSHCTSLLLAHISTCSLRTLFVFSMDFVL